MTLKSKGLKAKIIFFVLNFLLFLTVPLSIHWRPPRSGLILVGIYSNNNNNINNNNNNKAKKFHTVCFVLFNLRDFPGRT